MYPRDLFKEFTVGQVIILMIFVTVIFAVSFALLCSLHHPFDILALWIFLGFGVLTLISRMLGTVLFVFAIPLVNAIPYYFHQDQFHFIIFLFLAFFVGWMGNAILKRNPILYPRYYIGLAGIFCLLVLSSGIISVVRYVDFYPFSNPQLLDRIVNVVHWTSYMATRSVWLTALGYLSGIGFFLVIINSANTPDRRNIFLFTIIISIFLFTIIGYIQKVHAFGLTDNVWASTGRINATFTDPNALGTSIILLFPMTVFLSLGVPILRQKIIIIFATLCLIMALGYSGSRTGLAGVLFVVIYIALRWFKNIIGSTFDAKRQRVIVWMLIFTLFISSGIGGIYLISKPRVNESLRQKLKYPPLLRVLESVEGMNSISYYRNPRLGSERRQVWTKAFDILEEYPITGIGVGSFVVELSNYAAKDKNYSGPKLDNAGNQYIQVITELGLSGLVLYGLLCIIPVWLGVKTCRRYKALGKEYTYQYWTLHGLTISLITMLIFFNTGPHTLSPEVQMLFWLVIGLIFSLSYSGDQVVNETTPLTGGKWIAGASKLFQWPLVIIAVAGLGLIVQSYTALNLKTPLALFPGEEAFGFYGWEGRKLTWRWTNRTAIIKMPVLGQNLLIYFQASNPGIGENPLTVKLYLDDAIIDSVQFSDHDKKEWHYHFSKEYLGKEVQLKIEVDRTWTPREFLVNEDRRKLGIYSSEVFWSP